MTTGPVTATAKGDVLEVVIDHPPVNALSHAVRVGLLAALEQLEHDSSLDAMLLRGQDRIFVAGADITEFGKPSLEPRLPDLLRRLEASTKPVVAAIGGKALGGGLEVALACHHRVAAPSARLGLPEVKLGVIPGAGGTQLLPRLVGLQKAVSLITEGTELGAAAARDIGLVDEVSSTNESLLEVARAAAQRLATSGEPPRRTRDLPMPPDDPTVFEAAAKTAAKRRPGQEAPGQGIAAIRLGYELPLDEAFAHEAEMCRQLVASSQSRALRANFAAERAVTKVPGLPAGTEPRSVTRAAVVGLGVMGQGIAVAMANAGLDVVALAKDDAHLERGRAGAAKVWDGQVKRGRMDEAERDRRLGRIAFTTDPAALDGVELVVEAVSENPDTKAAVFAELGAATRPGTVLATNTSYLDVNALAAASGRPADVAGLHFFVPAHAMRLVEVVRGRDTAPDVVLTLSQFAARLGKLPVVCGVGDGFIVNRLLSKRSREGYFLLEEGATPAQVDRVVKQFGFPMGLFALGDLAGIDVQYAARQARQALLTPREHRANFVDQLYERGRYGRKTDAGWYRYDEQGKASDDPDIDALLAAHAEHHSLDRTSISDDDVRHRLLFAMVNEGARLLDEGIVSRPEDIDVAMVNGVGWPVHTGGPMWWADEMGLGEVQARVARFRAEQGEEYWPTSPLLERLGRSGGRFYDREGGASAASPTGAEGGAQAGTGNGAGAGGERVEGS